MTNDYVYIAFFVDRDELLKKCEGIGTRLERVIDTPHVTLAFRPGTVDEKLFGETSLIQITGYGNDGKNEGVSVKLTSITDPTLSMMVDEVETPHITVSVGQGGKPVNTRYLDFSPVEKEFEMTGVFGGFTNGKVVLESPEPVFEPADLLEDEFAR